MKKIILLYILFLGTTVLSHSQEPSFERKVLMIDSAYDARIDLYVKKCFPEHTIHIKFEKDSFTICSIEMALWVAPDISEDQLPVLEKFMTDMANYFNTMNIPIRFDHGFVPGSIDTNFDRMFKRKEIYVSSLEKSTTHSVTIDLISAFNKVTDSYIRNASRNASGEK